MCRTKIYFQGSFKVQFIYSILDSLLVGVQPFQSVFRLQSTHVIGAYGWHPPYLECLEETAGFFYMCWVYKCNNRNEILTLSHCRLGIHVNLAYFPFLYSKANLLPGWNTQVIPHYPYSSLSVAWAGYINKPKLTTEFETQLLAVVLLVPGKLPI